MNKIPLTAMLAIAAVCASAPAAAQSNFYLMGNVGRSNLEVDPASVDSYAISRAGLTASSTTPTTDDTAYKFQVGYRLTPIWSVEGGYANLGKVDYINVNNVATVQGTKEADLWNVDLVGTVPLNPTWSVLGRFGMYRWETKSQVPTSAGGVAGVVDNGYDFKIGLGLQYSLNKNFDFRAEFERYNGIGEISTTGDSKTNMMSVGVVLKF